MSTQPTAYQIPVEDIDFSPNISSEAENFFQTDADIARMAARQGMVNFDKGQAIKVSSKVLDMCLGLRRSGLASTTSTNTTEEASPAGEESNTMAAIVVEDKALVGATLFTAESGHVARKINLETGKTMKLYHGHTGPVTRVAVYQTHQGQERLITGSWDKTIRVWDTESKTCLATLKGHTDFVKALAVRTILVDNPEGGEKRKRIAHELFSASYDGTILHWDLETFEEFRGGAGGPWKGHARGINDLCLTVEEDNERKDDDAEEKEDHGKEYLYSAGSDGTIRKWDIERGQGRGGHCVHVFKHHETTVYRVIVEAGVEIWSTSADKTAQRLDLETKKVDTTLLHPDFVKSIALAGPYVVTGGRQESVRVWSVATGKLITEIKGHFDEVSSMVAVGTTLITGSLDNTVRRWSLKEQDLVAPAPKEEDPSVAALSLGGASETVVTKGGEKKAGEERKPGMMTEEEERELAELMGSDDDD
ncbi:WD40-repeat-containing domain protein [Linnemannia elongata]|nr:WD40-repeat-containing domain protein [Linnemannia elongata]